MSPNYPLLFFLLLIPLSGFVAWAGDRIGHRIGKRRHTFLNLRPRHTATLFTIACGMLIALVSFGLMWASNPTFRRLLHDGGALLANNRRLNRENRELQRSVTEQRAQAAHLSEDARGAREEAEAALNAKRMALQTRAAAEKNLSAAQGQVASARRVLARTSADLAAARGNLRTTQSQLREKAQRVAAARAQVRAAEARQRLAQSRAAGAEVLVRNARRTFDRVTARQKEELDRRKRELANLMTDLETRRAELKRLLGQTLASTTALRRNRITYQAGEELERTSIAPGLGQGETERALRALLTRAAGKAEARGAAAVDTERAVIILPKPIPMDTGSPPPSSGGGDNQEKIADEAESIAAAAEAIRQADDDVAVLVVASVNAVRGEPVPVELRTFNNRRVLSRNAVVGQVVLDGTRPQQVIADRLYAFLRGEVRERLRREGIIPPSPGAENFGGEDFVSIPGDQWFRVLEQVRGAGASVRVTIRAAVDLRAADAPALVFEVEPLRELPAARL